MRLDSLRPGVFLFLEEFSDGNVSERPIDHGQELQVRLGSRQRLKIYSSFSGRVSLGSFSKELSSGIYGGTPVQLASLVEHVSPEHQWLRLQLPETGYDENLVRLVTPHEVTAFSSEARSDQYSVQIEVLGNLSEMAVQAVEVGRGELVQAV